MNFRLATGVEAREASFAGRQREPETPLKKRGTPQGLESLGVPTQSQSTWVRAPTVAS